MTWTPLLTTKLEIGAVALALSLGGLWLHEHDQRIQQQAVAQAVEQTQAKLQQQYQAQFSDLQKQMADRDAQYQQEVKTLNEKFSQAASPTQVAALVAQIMGLKAPIQIVTPQATAENPHPVPVAEVSTLDAPQVKAYVQACEECKIENTKLVADAADRQAQAVLAQKQIESLRTENQALVVANKGGSTWHRAWKAVKYIAIGAGVGAVAVCGSGHCK